MSAGRRIGEQQRHILGANVAAVDPVGRASTSLDPARDFAFALRSFVFAPAFKEDRDFREVARRPSRRSGEDDIVHPAAAERLRAAFAHHPADGFEEVGFAASVRPDHAGEPRFDPELRRLDEALEAAEFQSADAQIVTPTLCHG